MSVPVDSIDLAREAKDEPCYKRLDPSVGATFAGLQRHNASSPSYEGTARGYSGRVGTWGLEYCYYSDRRLIGSRIVESAAYCNQIVMAHIFKKTVSKTRWFIESFG